MSPAGYREGVMVGELAHAEPPSPFVTIQGNSGPLPAPSQPSWTSDCQLAGIKAQQYGHAALPGIISDQSEHFQQLKPLDSPVEFEAKPVPRRSSADAATHHRPADSSNVVDYGPSPVRFMPLSSGWFSDSYSSEVGQQGQDMLQLQQQQQQREQELLLQQQQQQLWEQQLQLQQQQQQQQQQMQQQQQYRNGYNNICAGLLHQSASGRYRHSNKLTKLLSWGSSALNLSHNTRRKQQQQQCHNSSINTPADEVPPGYVAAAAAVAAGYSYGSSAQPLAIAQQPSVLLPQQQQQQVQAVVAASPPIAADRLSPVSCSPVSSLVVSPQSSLDSPALTSSSMQLAAVLAAAGGSSSCPSTPPRRDSPAVTPKAAAVPTAAKLKAVSSLTHALSIARQEQQQQQPGPLADRAASPGHQHKLQGQRSQRRCLVHRCCSNRRHSFGSRGREHQQYQQQAQAASAAAASGGLACHPSIGHAQLDPSTSLRSSLVHLEVFASARAGRIMDRIHHSLGRVSSISLAEGCPLRVPVGREVLRDWEFTGTELGRGASCVTRLVMKRADGSVAACKTINKSGIFRSAAVKAAMLGVQRELAIMQHTNGHPHVVQLRGVYEDGRNLHLVMECCIGGSLAGLAERQPGCRMGEAAAAAVAKSVLEVLALCHEKGVMHRDIKPENVLLSKMVEDPAQLAAEDVKVADFGISLPVTPGRMLTELAGTLEYMAPEVLQRCYCQQADIWSTGIMLYELITGQLPFVGNGPEQMLKCIQKTDLDFSGPAWAGVSHDAKQLIGLALSKDPDCRPSAQQLLQTFSTWLQLGCGLDAL